MTKSHTHTHTHSLFPVFLGTTRWLLDATKTFFFFLVIGEKKVTSAENFQDKRTVKTPWSSMIRSLTGFFTWLKMYCTRRDYPLRVCPHANRSGLSLWGQATRNAFCCWKLKKTKRQWRWKNLGAGWLSSWMTNLRNKEDTSSFWPFVLVRFLSIGRHKQLLSQL